MTARRKTLSSSQDTTTMRTQTILPPTQGPYAHQRVRHSHQGGRPSNVYPSLISGVHRTTAHTNSIGGNDAKRFIQS